LKQTCNDKVIYRNRSINWSPRSYDLTRLDFLLWDYLKAQVYVNNPENLEALKINIEQAIAKIRPDLYENVMEIG